MLHLFDQLNPVQLLLHKSTHEVTRDSKAERIGGADIQHVKGMTYRRTIPFIQMIRTERPRPGMLKVLLDAMAVMTLTARPAPA